MKIQRFRGVDSYGDRTLHTGGYSEKRQTYRAVKLLVLALITLCLLGGIQTTLLAKIPLFLLPSASPALCLLFVLATGCVFGEKEGGICGCFGGIVAECLSMDALLGGIMLLPLVYAVLGYASGVLFQKILAGNLPSFLVFAAVGSFFDGGFRYILMILRIGALPSFSFLTHGLLPVWILTVLFSPLIYLPVRAVKRKFDKDPLVT